LPLISKQFSKEAFDVIRSTLTIILGVAILYALIRLVYVAEEVILHHFRVDVKDNLRAREMHTRVKILRRLTIAFIIFVGLGVIFLSFDRFRELGTGLLASAGIAGIVLGLAAQRTLGNILAGIQIAITQPIRLDDVVIVEEEWGRIEEITLTYVVVRIWDMRRLILPISYFIEKPFQNWTRVSADILGAVFIYVDYTVPVDAIREELNRILQNSPHWDKKVGTVQMKALIAFLKDNYPQSLPKARVELDQNNN